MSKSKLSAIIVLAAAVQCVSAADVAVGKKLQAKTNARYLAQMGISHAFAKSIGKNIDWIADNIEHGPYGSAWWTSHKNLTQDDIDAVLKDVAAVLAGKTTADVSPALKGIESFAGKLHKDCEMLVAESAKLAVFLAASKDAESPVVASALLKRADKIRAKGLADLANAKCDLEAKYTVSYYLVDACLRGLGLWEVPKDADYWLFETISIQNWRDSAVGQANGNAKEITDKGKACIKLADAGMNVAFAVDGVVSAKTSAKAKAAVANLDKAIRTRIKILSSPYGSSRPSANEIFEVSAFCHDAYAMLLEYANGKTDVPAVKSVLSEKSAEAKRNAEKCRATIVQ